MLQIQAAFIHRGSCWRSFYIRPFLDFPLWNGACLLKYFAWVCDLHATYCSTTYTRVPMSSVNRSKVCLQLFTTLVKLKIICFPSCTDNIDCVTLIHSTSKLFRAIALHSNILMHLNRLLYLKDHPRGCDMCLLNKPGNVTNVNRILFIPNPTK